MGFADVLQQASKDRMLQRYEEALMVEARMQACMDAFIRPREAIVSLDGVKYWVTPKGLQEITAPTGRTSP